MKPRKTTKENKFKPAEAGTPSSKPELEDDDTEVVPPGVESAEAEEEKTRERAADDGMPDEDTL